jgi:plastocyanin
MKPLYTLVVLFFPFISIAQSLTSHNVDASDYNVFSPSDLTINLGDTVYFENLGSHNAVEVSEETYNSDGTASNGGFELYSDGYIVFEEVGTHYYVCTPHVQMGMKGTITVQGNPIQGQWYADIGDYVEITSNNFTIYIFDEEDCYEIEEYTYELNGNSMTLFDDGFEINVEVLNITPSSFSLSGPEDDIINLESATFDASEWVECDNESSWYCINESCFEDMDGEGEFDSLEECEFMCETIIQITYDCISPGECLVVMDGSGEFFTYEECEANCSGVVEDSWNCIEDACVDPMDGLGMYQSLEECEANCSAVVEDSWNCIEDACTDPMDGSGMYQSLEECEANCNATYINETNLAINIYPNPSSNIFNLELNTDSKSEIIVTNVLGEQVYIESTQSIGDFDSQIDLSNSSKGVYNLTIKTSYGISNHKLILQ